MFFTPQPHLHVPRTSFAVRAGAVFPATGTVMVVQTVMMVLMSPLPAVSTTHNNIHFHGRFIQIDIPVFFFIRHSSSICGKKLILDYV